MRPFFYLFTFCLGITLNPSYHFETLFYFNVLISQLCYIKGMKKKCSKCQEIKSLDDFQNANKGAFKKQAYCKPCAAETTRLFRAANRLETNEQARADARKPHSRYMTAKRTAKNRGIEFNLTEPEFCEFIEAPCFYCRGLIGAKSETGSNIDRVDPNLGYEYDNCLPCCAICNKIKNKFLSLEETAVAIDAVLKLRGLR